MLILENPRRRCFPFPLVAALAEAFQENSEGQTEVEERNRAETETRDPGDSRGRRMKGCVPRQAVREYSRCERQAPIVKLQKEDEWCTALRTSKVHVSDNDPDSQACRILLNYFTHNGVRWKHPRNELKHCMIGDEYHSNIYTVISARSGGSLFKAAVDTEAVYFVCLAFS